MTQRSILMGRNCKCNPHSGVQHAKRKRTSPTAYNVYSAYSVTSAHIVSGTCVTTSGTPVILPTPYSETLASASGRVTLDPAGEMAFISYLGFSTCVGGGLIASQTALVPVANVTTTTTRTGNSVPLAAASLSLAPVSSISTDSCVRF